MLDSGIEACGRVRTLDLGVIIDPELPKVVRAGQGRLVRALAWVVTRVYPRVLIGLERLFEL